MYIVGNFFTHANISSHGFSLMLTKWLSLVSDSISISSHLAHFVVLKSWKRTEKKTIYTLQTTVKAYNQNMKDKRLIRLQSLWRVSPHQRWLLMCSRRQLKVATAKQIEQHSGPGSWDLKVRKNKECALITWSFAGICWMLPFETSFWWIILLCCSLSLWSNRLASVSQIKYFVNFLLLWFSFKFTIYSDNSAVTPFSGFCHWNSVLTLDLVCFW